MVGRPPGLSGKEQAFIEHFAASGDAQYAAKQAGYSNAQVSAWRVLQRPEVIEAAHKQVMQRIVFEAAPLAVEHCIKVLKDPNASNRDKTTVAMGVFKHMADANLAVTGTKELHEMSLGEINAKIAELEARDKELRARDNVIEGEAEPVDLFD